MTTRLRYNFITGTISSLTGEDLTLPVGSSLGNFTVTSGVNYLPLVVNPATYGSSSTSEIVYVYSYTAGTNTAKVSRGQEGTSSLAGTNWPSNTVYTHGSLASDFGVVSGMVNGDFPTPTVSGQVFLATSGGASTPSWSSTLPSTMLSGSISASGISGYLSNATISGSQVKGNITATQISGGALQGSVTVSGSQVYGPLVNSTTISGSQVVGNISATQISGGALQNSVTISGSQVTGNIAATQISGGALQSSVTISGSQVTGAIIATQISGNQIVGSGSLPVSLVASGGINQALVTNASGVVGWGSIAKYITRNYTASTVVYSGAGVNYISGPSNFSGYSNYLITINGSYIVTGASGSLNLNIDPSLLLSGPTGPEAWSGQGEIFKIYYTTATGSHTFTYIAMASNLDPTASYWSVANLYFGTNTSAVTSSNVNTVYFKIMGLD